MIGSGLLVNVENLRARRPQDLHRPILHLGEDFLVVLAPNDLASGLRQPELVQTRPIQIHVGCIVRKHLAVRRKHQKCRIAGLYRVLIRPTESLHFPGPSYRPSVLIIELHAEAPRVIALARVHERWYVGVIEEAFIVNCRLSDQIGEKRLNTAGKMWDEILSQLAARVSQTIRIQSRSRHEKQRHALDASAGDYHAAPSYLALLQSMAVEESHAGGAVFRRDHDLPHDRIMADIETPGLQRQSHVHVVGVIFRRDVTTRHTVAAIVAGRTGWRRNGGRRLAHVNDFDSQPFRPSFYQQIAQLHGDRRQKDPIRQIFEVIRVSANAHLTLDAVVVRSHVRIINRPVLTSPIDGAPLEVAMAEPPCHGVPQHGLAADTPRPLRVESFDPRPHGRDMPVRKIERHPMRIECGPRVDPWPAFDNHHVHAALRQVGRQRTTGRTGADDTNIVNLRRHTPSKRSNGKIEYTPESIGFQYYRSRPTGRNLVCSHQYDIRIHRRNYAKSIRNDVVNGRRIGFCDGHRRRGTGDRRGLGGQRDSASLGHAACNSGTTQEVEPQVKNLPERPPAGRVLLFHLWNNLSVNSLHGFSCPIAPKHFRLRVVPLACSRGSWFWRSFSRPNCSSFPSGWITPR